MFGKKAKQENQRLEQENAALRQHAASLEEVINDIGGNDVLAVKEAHQRALQEFENFSESRREQIASFDQAILQKNSELQALQQKVVDLSVVETLQSSGLYFFEHPAEDSLQF